MTVSELGLSDLLPSPTNPVDDPSFVGGQARGSEGGEGGKAGGAGEAPTSDETAAAAAAEAEGMEVEGEGKEKALHPPSQHHSITPQEKDKILRQLHNLLLETAVTEGILVCGRCGFEYPIKEGVGNFLLPSHLGELYSLFFSLFSVLISLVQNGWNLPPRGDWGWEVPCG